jgi:hypothetical protein
MAELGRVASVEAIGLESSLLTNGRLTDRAPFLPIIQSERARLAAS